MRCFKRGLIIHMALEVGCSVIHTLRFLILDSTPGLAKWKQRFIYDENWGSVPKCRVVENCYYWIMMLSCGGKIKVDFDMSS